jgi:hypothetical protein
LEEIARVQKSVRCAGVAMLKACHGYGCIQTQIAAATGLHYSTVKKSSGKRDNSRFKV